MKTISHVYDSYGQARAAVEELEAAGIPSKDISVVANKYVSAEHAQVDDVSPASAGASIGAVAGGGAGALAGIGLLAIPGLGPVVAAGWAATAAVGAVTGAMAGAAVGGLAGVLRDSGEPEQRANIYSEAVRRGGTLVTARVADDHEERARAIFTKHEPVDPDARRREYHAAGRAEFDPNAPPYQPTEAEIDRIRHKGLL
ncbi:MAG: hypothetical protein IPK81_22170 [Rhodospirillales bacterium]|nr:MAG: hypothetical protein IPK81_22170 [Rhodospirillales bacterium]